MHDTDCTDQVVGDILSSWRYDISEVSKEMRTDYESHLAECEHCRSRQRLHRSIDVALIGLTTISTIAFVLALAVIHQVQPLRNFAVATLHLRQMSIALSLQQAAIMGLLFSAMAWVLVAIATPVPEYLSDVLQQLPAEIRQRRKHF